jgi:hypothetical protein
VIDRSSSSDVRYGLRKFTFKQPPVEKVVAAVSSQAVPITRQIGAVDEHEQKSEVASVVATATAKQNFLISLLKMPNTVLKN